MENAPQENEEPISHAPRSGVKLMIIILVGMALLAIYANVQKARREQIEKVTIIPISSAASPAASPAR